MRKLALLAILALALPAAAADLPLHQSWVGFKPNGFPNTGPNPPEWFFWGGGMLVVRQSIEPAGLVQTLEVRNAATDWRWKPSSWGLYGVEATIVVLEEPTAKRAVFSILGDPAGPNSGPSPVLGISVNQYHDISCAGEQWCGNYLPGVPIHVRMLIDLDSMTQSVWLDGLLYVLNAPIPNPPQSITGLRLGNATPSDPAQSYAYDEIHVRRQR